MAKKPRRKPADKPDDVNAFRGAMRVARFMIDSPSEEQVARWRRLSTQVQRMKNVMWYVWKSWHVERGHDLAVARYVDELTAWQREDTKRWKEAAAALKAKLGLGPKDKLGKKQIEGIRKKIRNGHPQPKIDVQCWPPGLADQIREALKERFPDVNVRVRELLQRSWLKDMNRQPAANAWGKRWHRVLSWLGEEQHFSREQPIPFDRKVGELHAPLQTSGHADWRLVVRIDRFFEEGKSRATSTADVIGLGVPREEKPSRASKKNSARYRLLWGCVMGDLKFCGSQILERKGQWYVHVSYQERKLAQADVDSSIKAVLTPGVGRPFDLTIGDAVIRVGGPGAKLAYIRRCALRKVAEVRESRKLSRRRKAGSGRRDLALRNALAGYKKTLSESAARQAIAVCCDRRAGTLVLRFPADGKSFLETAGGADSWPWHMVKSAIERQAERVGIKVISGRDATEPETPEAVA